LSISSPTRKRPDSASRAGAEALRLLSQPLSVQVLQAVASAPVPLLDLRHAVGSPPESTMRLYLRTLSGRGVVERRARREFPTSVDYAITRSGRGLLEVGGTLAGWLGQSPQGPIDLGTFEARNVIRPLAEGWSTKIVRALAARSLSLTELDRLIQRVSYPSLERRLAAMRVVDLVEGRRVEGGSTPYRATEWLRRAAAPLAAAVAWEARNLEAPAPIGRLDVEAVFLLATPLISLPRNVNGRCRLTVEVQRGPATIFAGVVVSVEKGEVTSYSPNLKGDADGWASGPPVAWLRRLAGVPAAELEIGGDARLSQAVIEGLRRTGAEPQSDELH
jgi:DNA-binding HxlR family transcriptional regulator